MLSWAWDSAVSASLFLVVSALVGDACVMASPLASRQGCGGALVDGFDVNVAHVPRRTKCHDSQQGHHVPAELWCCHCGVPVSHFGGGFVCGRW